MPRNQLIVVVATLALLGACNDISGASDMTVGTSPRTAPPAPSAGAPDSGTPHVDGGAPSPPINTTVSFVPPDVIDFGDNPCGSSPSPRSVEIRNQGTSEITFAATFTDGTFFSLLPATGSIAAGDLGLLTVSPPTIPDAAAVGVRTDTLTVTSSAPGEAPRMLDTRMNVTGAVFEVSQSSLTFGQLQSVSVSKQVLVRNYGNVDATLAYKFTTNTLNSFGVSPPDGLVIPAGAVAILTVSAHPPKSGSGLRSGTLAFSSSAPLCRPVPAALTLTCSRQN